ncbi:MAG: patatin-like phospholipase family protein [Paraglaciecola sp.]|nr:patatin-like phospholipase family protein [Paraglaciecola sp.]NCT47086.1 patatin-like phospholipase family protein [Paraglaciecola sp.]
MIQANQKSALTDNLPCGTLLKSEQGIKRSLVLPGGGLRLSYAAGAMQCLFAHDLKFGHIDATSGGALNLAMLFSGLHIDEMCARWASLSMLDTVAFLPFQKALDIGHFESVGSAQAFRSKVFPHLGIDFAKIRSVEGMQGTFNVGNFSQKLNEVVPHQHISEDFLIAGMSLPGVFEPVVINEQVYMDSGFIQDANLLEAVRQGADEIWLIWILANIPRYRSGVLDSYVQMLEMSANAALHNEIREIKEINARIAGGESVFGRTKPIVLHLIKPAHPLPLDPALYSGQITHAELIKLGYQDAQRYLNHHTKEGVPLEPYITKMTEAKLGLQFRETMSGGFALAATDPKQGSSLGKRKGFELAMHAQVDIDDINHFIKDGQHTGRLSGTIDFTPFGMGMMAHSGVFNLFYPDEQPGMKLMVYELGFSHQQQNYYLAGKKEVKDDAGFDLWTDTTTLFTTLHKGDSKEGEIVGAGILTLGVTDLLKLVSTIKVLNADSSIDKVATVIKFGQFFMGELWDSYVKLAK